MASIEVINVSQQNPEDPIEIKLSTSNITYRGPDGQPGRTPIKGVDYLTPLDISEIAAQIPQQDLTPYATKSYVDTAIHQVESGVLKRVIVQALPTQDIDGNTIYMVPKQGETGDVYDEFLYVNNAWEHIGSTDIDLSDYATISMLDDFLTPSDVADCVRQYSLPSTGITTVINDKFYELWEWFGSHTSLAISHEQHNRYYCYTFQFLPFDIYIDGHRIDQVIYEIDNITQTGAIFSGLRFYYADTGWALDGAKYYVYQWEYNPTVEMSDHLLLENTHTYSATNFKVNASQLNGSDNIESLFEVSFPTAFRYIFDNYVRKSELSQELSNSDIQAIWNNSGSQGG